MCKGIEIKLFYIGAFSGRLQEGTGALQSAFFLAAGGTIPLHASFIGSLLVGNGLDGELAQ